MVDESTEMNAAASDDTLSEMRDLHSVIKQADEAYYQNDEPVLVDAEYDKKKERLRQLERRYPNLKAVDSPTGKVGAPPAEGFKKARHEVPMLSLDNAFSVEEVLEFDAKVRRFLGWDIGTPLEYDAEPKIDGLSLSLTYVDGLLRRATTRGDGTTGEDVTRNAQTIPEIPESIEGAPSFMEVRGEIYMGREEFKSLNEKQEAASGKTYMNPRNAAAGSLRQVDPEITRNRKLQFFAHGFGKISEPLGATHAQAMTRLSEMGLPTNPITKTCSNFNEMKEYFEGIEQRRSRLAYDIDGVVFKVSRISLQTRLGSSSTAPRWAVSAKFPGETAWTTLRRIEIQVGRTGALSPVARLDPVTVGGVVVSNATLHNEDYIAGVGSDGQPIRDGKDLREGDWVKVYRAGDVIPKVADVDCSRRKGGSTRFEFPKACPACGSAAPREETDAVRRCSGDIACPAQQVERLKHFVSRNAFNVEGLGDRLIEQFHSEGLLRQPADIFKLRKRIGSGENSLQEWHGWGAKSASKLFDEIDSRRSISLNRLIFALGIRHVGEGVADRLALHFGTWSALDETLTSACERNENALSELVSVEGIGETIAKSLIGAFSDPNIKKAMDRLVNELKDVQDVERAQVSDSPISGITIVFTGTLAAMTRAEAKARAEALGARISGSVSTRTGLVVAGHGSGSKGKKAQELGVRVIDEAEWLDLVGKAG